MAIKFTKAGDGTIVLAVREMLLQAIEAPGWTDLRVGFLLSLCSAANNDPASPITGLAESIGTDPVNLGWNDRVRIGLTDNTATGRIFCGWTNRGNASPASTPGSSQLVSSDLGVGTTNTNFWRAKNDNNNNLSVQILDAGSSSNWLVLAQSPDGLQQHFAQNTTGAGGYATLSMMRFQRSDAQANAKSITISIPKMPSGHSSDVLFTNTPTEPFLRAQLEAAFPSTVQQFGPFTFSQEPNTFILYWPFSSSRLRIHAMAFTKAR